MDYLKHATDKNYSDFKDAITQKIKSKLRDNERIQAHTEKMDKLEKKINTLKDIQGM